MARPASRPTKFTPDAIQRFLDARKLGMTVKDAGALADWSLSVTKLFRQRAVDALERQDHGETLTPRDTAYVDFLAADEKAIAEFRQRMHAVIIRASQQPNHWQAAMTLLERRWPDMYGRRVVDVNAEVRGSIRVEVSATELLAELRALAAKSNGRGLGPGVNGDGEIVDVEEA